MRSQYILEEFDHEKLRRIAVELCDPAKMNILLRSKSCEGETDQAEEWYGTKYNVQDIRQELLQKMHQPNLDLSKTNLGLPKANNLIPKNFDILPKHSEFSQEPKLLKQWPDADLWYKKDDKFDRPKSVVSLKIYTSDCHLGLKPEARVFANVWTQILNEHLREFNYMANCANLSFTVSPMFDNVDFQWSGFNDSMPRYIDESITKLTEMKDSDLQKTFDQVKEKLLVDFKNFYFEQSYQQAFALFDNVMLNASVEQKVMGSILEGYSYEDFKEHHQRWLHSGR